LAQLDPNLQTTSGWTYGQPESFLRQENPNLHGTCGTGACGTGTCEKAGLCT